MPADSPPKRPVFLNPFQIRLPVTATVSFAHRISGLLLAVALPFLVFALSLSLRDAESYSRLLAGFGHPLVKLVLILLTWALAHHSAAGLRHLFMDIGIGQKLPIARKTAWAAHGFAVAAALLVAGALV